MMFDSPVAPYEIHPETVRILNTLLILHADHEQNCSTTAVRTLGSAQVNLYATISAGISALSGPLHGGANQAVVEMFRTIRKVGSVQKFLEQVKDKSNPQRLMGFGHRVYKTFDPRAKIIKQQCHDYLAKMHINDPLLDIFTRHATNRFVTLLQRASRESHTEGKKTNDQSLTNREIPVHASTPQGSAGNPLILRHVENFFGIK